MLRLSEVSDLVETTRTDVLSVSIDIDPTKPEHEHDPPRTSSGSATPWMT